MSRVLKLSLVWCLSCLLSAVLQARELSFAVEPFLTPRSLISAFQPMRDYVGAQTGNKVVLVTAKNYDDYLDRLFKGEFDLAIIGPHSALLAAQRAGYVPLLKAEGALHAVVLVRKDSPYQRLTDLKGQLVAFPDALTVTSMLGGELFKQAGLVQGHDITFRHNDYHNTAAMMLLRDEAAAAVVADSALLPMSPEIRAGIRVLAESKGVPQMVLLAHPSLSADERRGVAEAVAGFDQSRPPAHNFLALIGISMTRPLSDADIKQVAPYVEALKRHLELK